LRQRVRGGQPGEARAHHDDVRQGDVEREAAAFRDGARHDAAPPTRTAPPTRPVTTGEVTVTWWAGALTSVAGTAPSGPSSTELPVRLLPASGRRNDRRAPVSRPPRTPGSLRTPGRRRVVGRLARRFQARALRTRRPGVGRLLKDGPLHAVGVADEAERRQAAVRLLPDAPDTALEGVEHARVLLPQHVLGAGTAGEHVGVQRPAVRQPHLDVVVLSREGPAEDDPRGPVLRAQPEVGPPVD